MAAIFWSCRGRGELIVGFDFLPRRPAMASAAASEAPSPDKLCQCTHHDNTNAIRKKENEEVKPVGPDMRIVGNVFWQRVMGASGCRVGQFSGCQPADSPAAIGGRIWQRYHLFAQYGLPGIAQSFVGRARPSGG